MTEDKYLADPVACKYNKPTVFRFLSRKYIIFKYGIVAPYFVVQVFHC